MYPPKLQALLLIGCALVACSESESRPRGPAEFTAQGKLQLEAGNPRKAIASFRTALLRDAVNADAMAGLSMAYGLQQKVGLSDTYLRRAATISYKVGIAALEEGRDERAAVAFLHTLDLNRHHVLALLRLGEIAIRKGSRQEGIELFERAAKANPGYAESFIRLGQTHALSQDHDRARAAYERAIELNINSQNAYMGLGDLLSSEGKWAAAVEQYDKVLLIDPESRAARRALDRAREQL